MEITTNKISIVNQKGGVGKTSSTVNLAGALSVDFDRKVLVIDLDFQTNLTDSFEIIEEMNKTSYDLLVDPKVEVNETIYSTNIKGIDIIPSSVKLADIDIKLSDKKNRVNILKSKLDHIEGKYDFILIDCPPSLNLVVLNSLVASDSILIPAEPGLYSLKGLNRLIQTFNTVKKKYNKNLKVEGVLLTRVDKRTNIAEEFEEKLREKLGDKIFNTVISQRVAIVQAQIDRLPVSLYDKNSKSAEEYIELAREVISNEFR
ncbi:ParA family protein [Halonatronum saccharophilum]|uniref:ParA family protein n=1 Tax=Halonatronum saccharophilum TaxID=150060 RepID=UPI000484A53E|nr:ParA family protein [Halonatronum saccharophilum]